MSQDQGQDQNLSDQLDADIARVRAEIQSLTKRKQLLTSSLLASTKVQSSLTALDCRSSVPEGEGEGVGLAVAELTPLQSQVQHNETNVHRLAYGVTSFPFTDPNADTSDRPLLAVRFDIPSRGGRFDKAPYYLFLKRVHEQPSLTEGRHGSRHDEAWARTALKIHHHTIPALVPLQYYEDRYLSHSARDNNTAQRGQGGDVGDFSPESAHDRRHQHDNELDSQESTRRDGASATDRAEINRLSGGPAQDLHAMVTAVRRDLISWQLRNDAIAVAAEQLGLFRADHNANIGKYAVQSLQATAVDARFCRVVWQDGTVARLRLTDDGYIDRAVVIGDVGEGGRMDRMTDIERLLTSKRGGGRLNVVDVTERLKDVEEKLMPVT